MKTVLPSRLLKLTLAADAALGLLVAALHLSISGLMAEWLQLPQACLLGAGLFLVAWGLALGWLASRQRIAGFFVREVIAINVLWAVGPLWLAFGSELNPNALGVAYLVLNALTVSLFAVLEVAGLRASQAQLRAAHA